ncbi:MAG: PepSY domain-containing protein [Bacillus sp. (in: firmicutes)]
MKKKVIITAIVTIVLILIGFGTYYGMGYKYALDNEKYSQDEIENLALEQSLGGEILRVEKELEISDESLSLSEFVYEVEIKTAQNRAMEMTISSRTGVVDVD